MEGLRAFSLHFSKFKTSRLSLKLLKTCICISKIRGGGEGLNATDNELEQNETTTLLNSTKDLIESKQYLYCKR